MFGVTGYTARAARAVTPRCNLLHRTRRADDFGRRLSGNATDGRRPFARLSATIAGLCGCPRLARAIPFYIILMMRLWGPDSKGTGCTNGRLADNVGELWPAGAVEEDRIREIGGGVPGVRTKIRRKRECGEVPAGTQKEGGRRDRDKERAPEFIGDSQRGPTLHSRTEPKNCGVAGALDEHGSTSKGTEAYGHRPERMLKSSCEAARVVKEEPDPVLETNGEASNAPWQTTCCSSTS